MPSKYEHYYDNFGREVLRAGFMFREMLGRAERVMQYAQGIAPVDTGEYKNSFVVSTGVTRYGGLGTRAFGRVTNTAPHAPAVEFGYGNVPRHRTLGKSLHVAGGDVKVKRL